MSDWYTHPWMGIFPATLCPFHADESIDEDGLVGFAGFVPALIVAMTHAALSDDLVGARKVRAEVDTLARVVYAFGEPSGNAHQRMKAVRWLLGKFPSPVMRRPLRPLAPEAIAGIKAGLESLGYSCRRDAIPV